MRSLTPICLSASVSVRSQVRNVAVDTPAARAISFLYIDLYAIVLLVRKILFLRRLLVGIDFVSYTGYYPANKQNGGPLARPLYPPYMEDRARYRHKKRDGAR